MGGECFASWDKDREGIVVRVPQRDAWRAEDAWCAEDAAYVRGLISRLIKSISPGFSHTTTINKE